MRFCEAHAMQPGEIFRGILTCEPCGGNSSEALSARAVRGYEVVRRNFLVLDIVSAAPCENKFLRQTVKMWCGDVSAKVSCGEAECGGAYEKGSVHVHWCD